MSSLYSCKKLIKYFYKTKVFENISFDIEKNSIFQIKGQNGTGKTTLLKIIAGLDTDFEGNVLYKDSKLFNDKASYLKEVFFLSAIPSFYEDLTVDENFNFLNNFYDINMNKTKKNLFDCEPIKEKKIKNLSDGQRKKIQLSFAIAINPNVFIFDEPFNFLDVESRNELSNYFTNLKNNNKTILFSDNSQVSHEFIISDMVNLDNV